MAGTPTEQELRNTLRDGKIAAEVVAAKTHADGLAMLDSGQISAYFADRAILSAIQSQSKNPAALCWPTITSGVQAQASPTLQMLFMLSAYPD